MNKLISNITFLLILLITISSFGCLQDYEKVRDERSNKIIEQFNLQLKNKDYEEIYKNLSSTAKSLTPKDEFNERITKLVREFKKIDDSLTLKEEKGKTLYNPYVDSYFVYRKIESNNEKLDLEVTINTNENRLFDVCIMPLEEIEMDKRICLTNAFRKI